MYIILIIILQYGSFRQCIRGFTLGSFLLDVEPSGSLQITKEPLSDHSGTFVESKDSSVPETRHKQAIHHQPGSLGQTGKTFTNMPMKGWLIHYHHTELFV